MIKQEFVVLSCQDCGRLLIPLSDVVLVLDESAQVFSVAYPCTACGLRSSLKVSDQTATNLMLHFVPVRRWHRPAELKEACLKSSPFSEDDIARFVDTLNGPDADWFHAIVDTARPDE